ncbi:hypothetical protein DPMN_029516 [Dreissena polymorpha]|uniref:Uncharacterized protein n=1 Tax=Dreissena polymorpha TaxID=45954 RepID=A0A9D4LWL9_DREPO|nr:hypothetical protein DPMN_029516 [Dreissena polymorpha]
MRFLPSDENLSLRGSTLQKAIDEDLQAGLIPRSLRGDGVPVPGVPEVHSFAFNPSKWMMSNYIRAAFCEHESYTLSGKGCSRPKVPGVEALKHVREVRLVTGMTINRSGKLHMYTTEKDIDRDWEIIQKTHARLESEETDLLEDEVFEDVHAKEVAKDKEKTTWRKSREFGMSLVLSNVPMSPKVVNGSYAAFFDNMVEFAKEITRTDYAEKPIRLSPRRRIHLRDQSKQQSLDIAPLYANRNHPFFKQGSLDSKVEEILESYSNGGYSIKYPQDLSALAETEQEEFTDTIRVVVPTKGIAGKYDGGKSNGEAGGKMRVQTRDASNGVRLFCKHCGHVVDVDEI